MRWATTQRESSVVVASIIFLFTIILVIWQPRGLNIGWSASLGAALAIGLGTVSLADIPVVWGFVWNATATFIAIILITLILDEAGLFEWAALHVTRWGRSQGSRLFVLIVMLGALVSAFFTNDGAALILTPIVTAMLHALRFPPAAVLACVMAAGFVADTASLPLVVSNLTNIVSADFFNIGFGEYAKVMVPVNVVSVLATLAVLRFYFRGSIPAKYDTSQLKEPAQAIRDPATFRAGWVVLGLLMVSFLALEDADVPVSVVAGSGAVLLLAVAGYGRIVSLRKVVRNAPWGIVIFSLGMYLVVYGLRNAGLTNVIAGWLDTMAQHGIWVATLGTGLLAAALSSVMNNLPTVLIGALSVDASSAEGAIREAMIYANVIGSDLGPKITPIGSLATLLWLHILANKGVRITWGYYFRVGIVLTLPVLVATLSALALWLSLSH